MKVHITIPLTHLFNETKREDHIKLLNFVDSILKEFKISTYNTYRDFLQWGKIKYNPNTVSEKLVNEIKTSDLVLGVHPYEGSGTNITLGISSALKKPILIVLDKNFDLYSNLGLMYRGLGTITKSEIIVYNDLEDLRKKLRKFVRELTKAKS